MNKEEKKKLLGILGIVLVITSITGLIPSAIRGDILIEIIFGILGVFGIILAVYNFSD